MSTTIDQRVVEMRFDNKQFESNVSTTMSTLDKLKQKLNLTGAAKGLTDVGTAAKKVDLSPLAAGAEAIQVKFSYMQASIQHQLNSIVDGAVSAGKRIVSALTIDPIKTGFSEYELKMNSVQTIMASTGADISTVNRYLEELNTYSDQTIYSFSDMTASIGKFTNAGVSLQDAVAAIKGVSNVAAVSGANTNEASRAMYNFAQALSAGHVKLMDWKSIENANMATVEFKQQLIESAVAAGTLTETADGMYRTLNGTVINATKNFNESLQDQWMTTDVLVNTLSDYADASTEIGKKATEAATQVKTVSQLYDTLKESAQSGWAQTWEIIVGDLEEAKAMLTKVSDVIGKMIGDSAEARNNILQGWESFGGRENLINGIANAFNGLMGVVKPIKEAFRDIFPQITFVDLLRFTAGFKNLTASFAEFTTTHGNQIKSTFKGVFAVIDIGWTVVKKLASGLAELIRHFTGLGGSVLDITGSLGDWLYNVGDSIKKTDIFGVAVDKVVGFLSGAINAVKNFGRALKEYFNISGFVQGVWDIVSQTGAKIGEMFAPLMDGIANVFSNSSLFDAINSGLLAGGIAGIFAIGDKLASPFEALANAIENVAGEGGLLDGVKSALDDVRGCFEAYQNQLNAGTLQKIATAIGILAASIFVIASIDSGKLDSALGALTVLFVELLGSLGIFSKISSSMKGVTKACGLMISMGISIAFLAGSMKTLSTIDGDAIVSGLFAIGVMMAELAAFLAIAKFNSKLTGTAVGIVILSSAMLVLAQAVKNFGELNASVLIKGIGSIGALLLELGLFTKLTGNAKNVTSTGLAMVLLAGAMKILASAMKDFGAMKMDEIGRGLAAMGGALVLMSGALRIAKGSFSGATSLLAASAAMMMIVPVMKSLGEMQWPEIGRGLTVMGLALAELAIALGLMSGSLAGAAALIIVAGALAIIAPVMQSLGDLSWSQIVKGLASLAGAFAVIGIAGALLTPLIPALIGLAGALALFGVATLGIGAGMALIGVGISAIASSLAVGATAIVAGLAAIIYGIVDIVPAIVLGLGDAILAICTVIKECAPALVDTIFVLIAEVCNTMGTYIPMIADSLFGLLIGALDVMSARMPELISSAMNVIGSFFQGIVDALGGLDTSGLLKGIVGVGLIAALMAGLSALTPLIPSAMIGVLGMGVLIAELAAVLAAVGLLAQIPGLSWLIGEGGDLLQQIGTAIGQFVGGLAGGIAEGATGTLPQVGANLSGFMTNLQPFIDGMQGINASVLDNAKTLASTILTLTAADLLSGITSFFSGGSSLADFGTEIASFGTSMKAYSSEVSGIDIGAVSTSVDAAKNLVKMAQDIPSDGLLGTDGIDDFGRNITTFGKSIKEYASTVADIDTAAVAASVSAAKDLVAVAKAIPDDGAFGTDGIDNFGDNIADFAKSMKDYSDEISGVSTSSIYNSTSAIKHLADTITGLAGIDTSGISSFKTAVSGLAETNVSALVDTFGGAASGLESVGASMAMSIGTGLKSGQSQVTSIAESIVNDTASIVNSKSGAFKDAGSSLMAALISGINSGASGAKTAAGSAASGAATGARGYYNSFYSAGEYLVIGFADGMANNEYRATNAGIAIAKAAYEAAMAELDINSPSRVGYEIGDFFGIGFANGIVDNVSIAYDVGSEMASGARNGLSDAISRIKDVIDGNIEAQPTIRPVLDLSNVRSGADAISSMFGTGMSVSTLANVGTVSSMMRGYSQNTTNDDVVSAIDKLRGELGNIGGDSYTINGITYDDGSNVTNAVRELVRATKIGRRV